MMQPRGACSKPLFGAANNAILAQRADKKRGDRPCAGSRWRCPHWPKLGPTEDQVMDAKALRARALAYRRRAEKATDAAVKESLLLLAEIDEEEANLAESPRGRSDLS